MPETKQAASTTVSSQQSMVRPSATPGIADVVVPSLQFGLGTGTVGVFAGIGGAIAKDISPVIGGMFTGFQWFTVGGSYWLTRSLLARASGGDEQLRPIEKTAISAVSGTAAGAVSGLLRGPTKIIPSMIVWSLVGAGGQLVTNRISIKQSKPRDENDSWLRSKWSPLQKLTDQEYITYLEEKRLRVDADIALIDERIAALQQLRESQEKDTPKTQ
ncbi:hypothetical protein S40293_00879 [Stachybotrys chartarum IBT 40293]|nr:hypothetical protein S40293_00879 [Stachybotrys chartarum IBT 40293]